MAIFMPSQGASLELLNLYVMLFMIKQLEDNSHVNGNLMNKQKGLCMLGKLTELSQ